MLRIVLPIVNFLLLCALVIVLVPELSAQTPTLAPDLTCSPAPCVFSNMQVSSGSSSVYSNVIVANPNNSGQFLVSGSDFNCDSVGLFSSLDAGATWTHVCLPPQPNQAFGVAYAIAGVDLNNVAYSGGIEDRFYHASRLVVSSSRDNGLTWRVPTTVLSSQVSIREPWLQVDTDTSSPFKNTVYIAATTYAKYFSSQITVSHSGDGGKTWSTSVVDKQVYPTAQYYSNLATAKDGSVYVTWARCKPKSKSGTCGGSLASLLISKSVDGGVSWSVPVRVAQARLTPTSDSGDWEWGVLPNTVHAPVSNIPVVAVDNSTGPHSGNVYVAYYNYNGKRMQVGVTTSKDGGSTWSAPVLVSNSTLGDEFFHWISVASDGKVGVTWLDRRNDPANVKYQPFSAISTDGGATFGPNVALSTTMSDPFQDPFMGSFIGDYRTQVWVGNALYATWMDTRTGNCQVELGGEQF